jgi:hypothetical protein
LRRYQFITLKLHDLPVVQRPPSAFFSFINVGVPIRIFFVLLIYRDFSRRLLNCSHAIIFNEHHFGKYASASEADH